MIEPVRAASSADRSMDRRRPFSVSIVCLLITLAVASGSDIRQKEDTRSGRNTVTGSSEQEAAIRAESAGVVRKEATPSRVLAEDAVNGGRPPPRSEGDFERIESTEDDRGEDYEVEVVEDGYEEELKAVAESHEAMSRDDTRNSDVSTTAAGSVVDPLTSQAKNFHSHEVITVNDSDEDVASNEAITDEIIDKYDQEVAELLKYKKERASKIAEEGRKKSKRVPTVKKELNTQREIQLGSNETEHSSLLNGLNEEAESFRRRNTGSDRSIKSEEPKNSDRSSGNDDETTGDDRCDRSKPKKPVKRQDEDPLTLKDRLTRLKNSAEEEIERLRELGMQEDGASLAVALKPLVEAIEALNRLGRLQDILDKAQRRLDLLRQLKTEVDNLEVDPVPAPEPAVDPRKSRKRSMKKKIRKSKERLPLSRSWPEIPYDYRPAWTMDGPPPLLPETWPWRVQDDLKYWPAQRNSFLPVEKKYRTALNEEEEEEEAEADLNKIWQQQRAHAWERNRPGWPTEKPVKASPPWQQDERSMKQYYDRVFNFVLEKSKNRSELNKPSTKQEVKDSKVVLPQITMKTWNSLTSDPATWPQKFPGAKPWPKDENGKSYNPNADLVKKLGLDKQNNGAWSKEESEKSNAERKSKEGEKQRLFPSKESSKEEEYSQTEVSKYRGNSDRSNFSESIKPWAMLTESKASKDWSKSENMQNDDARAWESKNSWSSETNLPKIQSVGAWVMAADQSIWKPYEIKSIDPSEEASRRWNKPVTRSDGKWISKGSWTDKVNDSWMDQPNVWPEKKDSWLRKSDKPSSWFSKSKEDTWTSKSGNPDSWKVKGDWLGKPESSRTSKMGDSNSWAAKSGSWSTKSNESWPSKVNDDAAKFTGDSWSAKGKEDESWKPEDRKLNDQNGELSAWQQKVNDEWNYGKSSSAGTWSPKWKQFAYHRVTAMPISKPGTTADAAASKVKNAFVAVSAVSSPKYSGSEWRKDEEARNEKDDPDRMNNQLQVALERPLYAWKKDPGVWSGSAKGNGSDSLENELEALRQIDFWSNYKDDQVN